MTEMFYFALTGAWLMFIVLAPLPLVVVSIPVLLVAWGGTIVLTSRPVTRWRRCQRGERIRKQTLEKLT